MIIGHLAILQPYIILFNEPKKLPDLVRFGLTADILEINKLGDAGMPEDMVTAPRAKELESESFE